MAEEQTLKALPNELRAALEVLGGVSQEMAQIAHALKTLGMLAPADRLRDCITVLTAMGDEIEDIGNRHFSQMLKDTEQSSINVLRAALAGAGIGGKGAV